MIRAFVKRLAARYLHPLIQEYLDHNLETYIERYVKENWLCRYLVFGDESRLEIAKTAVVNNALFNLSSGKVIVEDYAFFGHNVSILTGTHDYHRFDRARQIAVPCSGQDIIIGRGSWVGSGAIVLGPSVIGEHAVVAAGSVVDADVPAYAIVAGMPARVVKTIDPECQECSSATSG